MLARLRASLLTRLLLGSILIAVCAISATAWLAAQTTSGAIRREQGENVATGAEIYDTLMGYAATHPRWDEAQPVLDDLRSRTGKRIVVTTIDRVPIAAPAAKPAQKAAASRPALPATAAAVVDPLSVQAGIARDAGAIDPRAVGPFALSAAERAESARLAARTAGCQRGTGIAVDIRVAANGRSYLSGPQPTGPAPSTCSATDLNQMTGTERAAWDDLNDRLFRCVRDRGQPAGQVLFDPSGRFDTYAPGSDPPVVAACLDASRRDQLRPYVAPPALLFIADPAGPQPTRQALFQVGTVRVAGAAGLVLILAVGTSVALASRLVRPFRALTAAARRMRDGDRSSPMTVRGTGEIALLADAFNDMSDHLQRTEDQRKAMMSDVSHELRTPLSNIRGYLESAQDGVSRLDPALVSSLLEETMQLQHLVQDLQDLALAESGELRLHPEPLAVADVLDQVAAAHQPRADAAGIALRRRVHDDPGLTADPVRLRQIVGNLVSNALRHTPAGGSVRLTARTVHDQVAIEVADTGAGIAASDLPHLFDRFWRADKSRNRRSGGSGLGLAVVRNLVEAHGGTVTVASTPGAGTTFTVRLPVTPT